MNWKKEKIKEINDCCKKNPARKKLFLEQLEKNGWTEMDTWSLDVSLAKFLVPRLEMLKEKMKNMVPNEMPSKKWHKVLDEMIDGFKFVDSSEYFYCSEKERKKVEKALDHLKKYFSNLWW